MVVITQRPVPGRVYAQALLVLDDDDFYRLQTVFTLGQQRGIATALNTLVFRTFCPPSSLAAAVQPGASCPRPDYSPATAACSGAHASRCDMYMSWPWVAVQRLWPPHWQPSRHLCCC